MSEPRQSSRKWREVPLELQPEPSADLPPPSAPVDSTLDVEASPRAFQDPCSDEPASRHEPYTLPELDEDSPTFQASGQAQLPSHLQWRGNQERPLNTSPPSNELPTPGLKERSWSHPVARILIYFALMAVLSVAIFAILSARVSGYLQTHPSRMILAGVASETAAALISLWLMTRYAERRPMSDAGFSLRGSVMETTAGTMIGISLLSVTVGVLALARLYTALGVNSAFHPWLPLAIYLLIAIAEETMFRGYVLRVLEQRYGSFVALAGSSLLFGFVHLLNQADATIPLAQRLAGAAFLTIEGGLLLGVAYLSTRRLWLPIGIHWAWNYFEGPVYGSNVSGIDLGDSLIRSSLHGPFLLTGGAYGPEASIVCLVFASFAALLLLRVAVRAGQWRTAAEATLAQLPDAAPSR